VDITPRRQVAATSTRPCITCHRGQSPETSLSLIFEPVITIGYGLHRFPSTGLFAPCSLDDGSRLIASAPLGTLRVRGRTAAAVL
jgi:hypothetical protein